MLRRRTSEAGGDGPEPGGPSLLSGLGMGRGRRRHTTCGSDAPPLLEGQTPGVVHNKYKLGKVVGMGSFSVVREAENRQTGAKFACKVITHSPGGARDSSETTKIEDVAKEIRLMQSLDHKSIMKIEEFFHHGSKTYIITELLTGGELLEATVYRGSLPESDAREIFVQLMSALSHMHANNVVHRDIKLENLLLTRADDITQIKVADFGLSASNRHDCPEIDGLKALSTVCGTPSYVAPEIIDRKGGKPNYGPSCDIWSAGVVLFYLLSGYPPFQADGLPELFKKIRAGLSKHEFKSDPVWELITDEAKDLIQKLLTTDTNHRMSAEEALAHPWCTDC